MHGRSQTLWLCSDHRRVQGLQGVSFVTHSPQLCALHLLQTQTRQVHQIEALSEICLDASPSVRPSVCVFVLPP